MTKLDRERRTLSRRLLAGALLCLAVLLSPLLAQTAEPPAPVVLILDVSGSMWGQIDSENKIVIARRVIGDLVAGLPDAQEIGLVAYGHRREGDCADIETLTPLGPLDREAFRKTVEGLTPKGKTPITGSVERALELVEQHGGDSTVILVSDGLETCGGDPCATVRLARDEGLDFVLHVIGFDVAGEDTSSLECSAEAAGGLFLSAENADELGGALQRAVALAPDVPDGRLAVRAVRNGALHDVSIQVTDAAGNWVAGARTYSSETSNPSSIPLPDGTFRVEIEAMGIDGATSRDFPIEIVDGSTVERTVDFSTGELSIGARRNGELTDATYSIRIAATDEVASQGRTYEDPNNNPDTVVLTAGRYRVVLRGVAFEKAVDVDLGEVEIVPGERAELSYDFPSGDLLVGATRGSALVDAVVNIYASDGTSVGGGRTYTAEASNPKRFVLAPGEYRIRVQEVRGPRTEIEVTVGAGETVERSVDFAGLEGP